MPPNKKAIEAAREIKLLDQANNTPKLRAWAAVYKQCENATINSSKAYTRDFIRQEMITITNRLLKNHEKAPKIDPLHGWCWQVTEQLAGLAKPNNRPRAASRPEASASTLQAQLKAMDSTVTLKLEKCYEKLTDPDRYSDRKMAVDTALKAAQSELGLRYREAAWSDAGICNEHISAISAGNVVEINGSPVRMSYHTDHSLKEATTFSHRGISQDTTWDNITAQYANEYAENPAIISALKYTAGKKFDLAFEFNNQEDKQNAISAYLQSENGVNQKHVVSAGTDPLSALDAADSESAILAALQRCPLYSKTPGTATTETKGEDVRGKPPITKLTQAAKNRLENKRDTGIIDQKTYDKCLKSLETHHQALSDELGKTVCREISATIADALATSHGCTPEKDPDKGVTITAAKKAKINTEAASSTPAPSAGRI